MGLKAFAPSPYTTLFRSVLVAVLPPLLYSAAFYTSLRDLRQNIIQIRSEETRLNSSHRTNSYAVFCLKKKKISRKPKYMGLKAFDPSWTSATLPLSDGGR